MRSDSDSVQQAARWRLKRTLRRKVEFRLIETMDMPYIWAAYRKGCLAPMGEQFADGAMKRDEFRAAFEEEVVSKYQAAWIVLGENKRGFIPIGMVFGAWAPLLPFMIVGGIAWFPWASDRNIIEGTVGFFNAVRNEIPMMGYANNEQKRLYEVCCMHGIMRRVGTSHIAFADGPAAVFETRI